jgi:hypothetical protein
VHSAGPAFGLRPRPAWLNPAVKVAHGLAAQPGPVAQCYPVVARLAGQGDGDGDALWRRVIDGVAEPGSGDDVHQWWRDDGGLQWSGRDLPARREWEVGEERPNRP